MIEIIKADKRHFLDLGWLKTYWLFSFSDYFDPHNIQFGPLRVFNDDMVEPGTGYPTHPHEEMEIVMILLEGELAHQDSLGNRVVVKAGDVLRLSAGTGLTCSEFNPGDRPAHFCQIWMFPDIPGLEPTYSQKQFQPSDWQNRLLPVASGQDVIRTMTIHADATIYRCALEPGKDVIHEETTDRRIFVYVTDGHITANGETLMAKDQARIDIEAPLILKARQQSELILIDVPSCRGWGYSRETLKGMRK